MRVKLSAGAARDLQALFTLGKIDEWTDGELLDRFRAGTGPASESAFAALVHRHGPMIARVCRDVLADEHDVQDAFQATFLVLVQRGGMIRNRASVASWLYGVALRVASRAKADAARRRSHERQAATMKAPWRNEPTAGEGASVHWTTVDAEIRRLPEKYRAPILLCYVQGLSQEQAARHLGWPSGTVRGRISKARDLLRTRLARRGVGLPAVGTLPSPPAASGVVPSALFDATVRGAACGAASAAKFSPAVIALAKGATLGKSVAGLKVAVAAVGVAVGVASVGLAGGAPRPPRPWPRAQAVRPLDWLFASNPKARPAATAAARSIPGDPPQEFHVTPDRDPAAVAVPVSGIRLDGDLGDWPKGVRPHPLLKQVVGGQLGAGGTTPEDLAASFSVGYDLEAQLIYLAVVVRDDWRVIGHSSHLDTDALEVYVDGLHGTRKIDDLGPQYWEEEGTGVFPVQQYAAIPGSGRIYGSSRRTNPVLFGGDLDRTRTRMAYKTEGDVTTYEWAIQPFDRYPDRPTKLEPGKHLGFDVAVADRDVPLGSGQALLHPEEAKLTWIYWGPRWSGMKILDAGNLGDLILAPADPPGPESDPGAPRG